MKIILTYITFFFLFNTIAFGQTNVPQYSKTDFYIKLKTVSKKTDTKSKQVNVTEELPFLLTVSTRIKSIERPFYSSSDKVLQSTYRISIADSTQSLQFVGDLKNRADIEYIEPVPVFKLIYIPNDPSYSSQYHLGKLKAPEAWDITKGNVSITVAIVDDAVEINHPDLAENVVPGWDMVDNDNDPTPPSLSYDHGTHVAGIVGAVSDNGIGIASIGLNKAKIMGIRASNSPGYITHGFEGVTWAATHGAKIINMSWGGAGYSLTGQQVMNDAASLGAILVAAAGNSSTNSLHYPSAYNNVVAVASTTNTDALSYFSNYGSWVDICAPGSSIYSTVPFGSYDTYSGTSMASPLTAGALAFIWSVMPTLNNNQIIDVMKTTADNINAQNSSYVGQLGSGRINLLRAVTCSGFTASVTPLGSITLCNSSSSQVLTAAVVSDATYKWYNGNTQITGAESSTYTATATGNYFVAITANGCTQSSNVVSIQAMPLSGFTITSPRTPATLCNDSFTLTAPLVSGVTYSWTKDGVVIPNLSTNSYVVDRIGSYSVTITKEGCTSVVSAATTVTGLDLVLTPTGNVVLCTGESQVLSLPSNSSALFQWKNGTSFVGNNTNTLTVNQSGSYYAIVTTSACGSTNTQTVNVGVIPTTINITTTTSPIICVNSTVTINAPVISGVKYHWQRNGVNVGINQATLTATQGGEYRVIVSKIDSSCAVASQVLTIEEMNTSLTLTPSSPVALCNGESVVIRSNPLTGVNYSWKKNGVTIGSGADSLQVNESGLYKLEATRYGCSIESTPISVNIIPSVLPITSATSTLLCEGGSVLLETTSLQGMTYVWKKDNLTLPSSNNNRYTVTSAGKYVVSVQHPISSCIVSSDTLYIKLIENTLGIIPNEIRAICLGDSLLLSSTTIVGGIYNWQKNSENISGATSSTYTAKTSGIYRLKATVVGCVFYSNPDTLNVFSETSSPPNSPINVTVCEGQPISALSVSTATCPIGGTSLVNYTGGTVGYDGDYQSGPNPTVTISDLVGSLTAVEIGVTWEKKDGDYSNSCGVAHRGGSPWLSEMSIRIKSPNGTLVTLIPSGFYGGNYAGVITQTFKVGGAALSSLPASGTFSPYQSFNSLLGSNPTGVWELVGNDNGGADPLCISGFSVKVTTGVGSSPTPTVTWWDGSTAKTGKLASGTSYVPNKTLPGTYTFYAQSECQSSCPSTRIPVMLTITAKPTTPTIIGKVNSDTTASPITICSGQSAVLSGSCAAGILTWSNGQTEDLITISPTEATTFTATCVTPSGTCQVSDASNEITVVPAALPLVITQPILSGTTQIFSGATILGKSMVSTQSRIDYRAQNSVTLEPGFSTKATSNSVFNAYVGNCIN